MARNSTCFGQFLCSSSGVHSLYTEQWCMSYRFSDSCPVGPGWNCVPTWSYSKAVYKPVWHIPLLSVQWMNSWWWTEKLSETCRVSCQNKYVKLVPLIGFIIKEVCEQINDKRHNIKNSAFLVLIGLVIRFTTHGMKNIKIKNIILENYCLLF